MSDTATIWWGWMTIPAEDKKEVRDLGIEFDDSSCAVEGDALTIYNVRMTGDILDSIDSRWGRWCWGLSEISS